MLKIHCCRIGIVRGVLVDMLRDAVDVVSVKADVEWRRLPFGMRQADALAMGIVVDVNVEWRKASSVVDPSNAFAMRVVHGDLLVAEAAEVLSMGLDEASGSGDPNGACVQRQCESRTVSFQIEVCSQYRICRASRMMVQRCRQTLPKAYHMVTQKDDNHSQLTSNACTILK